VPAAHRLDHRQLAIVDNRIFFGDSVKAKIAWERIMAGPLAVAAAGAGKAAATAARVAVQVTARTVAAVGRGAAAAANSGAKGFSTTIARAKTGAGQSMARTAQRAFMRRAATRVATTNRGAAVRRRLPSRSPSRALQDQSRLRVLGMLANRGSRLFPDAGRPQPLAARPSVRAAVNDMPPQQLHQFSRALDQSRRDAPKARDDLQGLVQTALTDRGEGGTYITVNNGGTVRNGPTAQDRQGQPQRPDQPQRRPRARTDMTRNLVGLLRQISPHDR
jgi:hypothetical protein